MKFQSLRVSLATAIGLFLTAGLAFAQDYTFTTIADPLAVYGTRVEGISGNNIVGSYTDANGNQHGFIYNGSTFETVDYPGAASTVLTAVSGNTIIGSDGADSAFIYSGGTFQSPPTEQFGGGFTSYTATMNVTGISGATLAGLFVSVPTLYNLSSATVTTLQLPYQNVQGISVDGNELAGWYGNTTDTQGFFYDGSTYTSVDDPLAVAAPDGATYGGTEVLGLSGNNVVGLYFGQQGVQGFLYNGGNYTTITDPNAYPGGISAVTGIDGTTLVGTYQAANGIYYGFEAVATPEPKALLLGLLSLAGYGTLRFARSRFARA